jgi:hypothetical protein
MILKADDGSKREWIILNDGNKFNPALKPPANLQI